MQYKLYEYSYYLYFNNEEFIMFLIYSLTVLFIFFKQIILKFM